jgi:predicted ATP-dependent serine protease
MLLAGPPGHGKTTRCLLLLEQLARLTGKPALIECTEMPKAQVQEMAERVGVDTDRFFISASPFVDVELENAREHQPCAMLFDSLRGLRLDADPKATSVRILSTIRRFAEEIGMFAIVIQHVTKDWTIAGSQHEQHEVDIVAFIERNQLRTTDKCRTGPSPRETALPPLT